MPHPLILLVEDNSGDVGLWCEALEVAGISRDAIVVAEHGEAALGALTAHASCGTLPRLIISDSRLPGMDGVTLNEHLRSQSLISQVPFVIVSGAVPSVDQQHGVGWFEKPHDFDSLCILARKLCATFVTPSQFPSGPRPPLSAP
jgi:CheY-like chemotaxis protein